MLKSWATAKKAQVFDDTINFLLKENDAFILIYNHGIFSILRSWTSTMYDPNLGAAMERFFGSSKAWM